MTNLDFFPLLWVQPSITIQITDLYKVTKRENVICVTVILLYVHTKREKESRIEKDETYCRVRVGENLDESSFSELVETVVSQLGSRYRELTHSMAFRQQFPCPLA